MGATYKKAGVDIEAGEKAVSKIKDAVKKTQAKAVMGGIGGFGALYDLNKIRADYKEPVLVQSIDGVGTKVKIAQMLDRWDTIGQDIVAHSCNDILCQGAQPLTFLDYIATAKLDPDKMADIVKGMAKECQAGGVSLVGGETAEMPGVYSEGEWDVVGTITGVVEKENIIDGSDIKEGDLIIGLGSNGLHTNGYSLARHVLFDQKKYSIIEKIDTLKENLGETLLKPHLNYVKPVQAILEKWPIKGMAHITGGGLEGNLSRVLPKNIDVEIEKGTWEVLPIFNLIQKDGDVPEEDMYKTFNMGVGMVLVVSPEDEGNVENVLSQFKGLKYNWIGKVKKGFGKVILT
ncbi:phosphoribosylformylglycinamidine cyclo-ligase [Patescibacteria group bacterium]|nr:phosphoribosylformylglycinamidine cyclo-ligase [Patescibacteria group bacterium]MBU1673342.1 phosphoribosylformylglycinamidine cyclo-ligase [Patescibacteria group bacterium]MBU1963539.1 phosphoribosylformylglycinamidine cyclo-ligase [Patescibacteria group bacterium]